jgi:DNA-binding transcriptional MerR regulator
MSNTEQYFLGIGDFSRFTLLSVRMLRHYDERGLLVPDYVDPANGYRFYSPGQLKVAGRIRALRDVGCGITQITELLPLFFDADAVRAKLEEHGHSLEVAAQKIADQQALLSTILNQIKESDMSITVETRTLPALTMVALRETIADYHSEGELWAQFSEQLKTPGSQWMSHLGPRFGATFYDSDYRESDIDMAVWAEYSGDQTPPAPVTLVTAQEQQVAYATLYGSYEGTAAVCEAIGTWIAAQGLTPTGPMFNLYIIGPSQDPNPDNWVTEINYPVA